MKRNTHSTAERKLLFACTLVQPQVHRLLGDVALLLTYITQDSNVLVLPLPEMQYQRDTQKSGDTLEREETRVRIGLENMQ